MTTLQLSKRAQGMPASPIRKLASLARQCVADGKHLYCLNIGQPDLEASKLYREGVQSYDTKVVAYEISEGNIALREAWTSYINKTLDLSTRPEQYIVTMGASEALSFVFQVSCDPGDEILVFDPSYANYLGFAASTSIKLVPVPTYIEQGFALPDNSEIESRLSPKTKAVLLCSPNNPTGTVYNQDDLKRIIDLCVAKNLLLIADETYRELVYDGRKALSVLHIAPDSNHIVVVDSLSKRFSLCGARVGCFYSANEEIIEKVLRCAQARLSISSLEQHATAYMLNKIAIDFVDGIREEYVARRDTLHTALSAIPNVTAHLPGGAFYTMVKLPVDDAEDFAKFLLQDFSYNGATLFVSPAEGFYVEAGRGRDEIRLACVLNAKDIEDAIEVLGEALKTYNS